jgi:hypothetical protein
MKEGGHIDCDLTCEASCSPPKPHLLTRDTNDLIRDLNLSKKQAVTLRLWIKMMESSTPRYRNMFLLQLLK